MSFLNIGLPEVIFIIILALIIFGPNNLMKSAREAGEFLRKVTKSPYWQEVWATKRELDELPKMLAKEANLDETLRDLESSVKDASNSTNSFVSQFIKEATQPLTNNPNDDEIPNSIMPPKKDTQETNQKE
jgi:Sec-independent protein translocase protein TatA